jgi:tetratricopeptide (TPR) repeat protein
MNIIEGMNDDLRRLLFENGRVGKVLEVLCKPDSPDPQSEPSRALLYGHALCLNGDAQRALNIYSAIPQGTAYDAERLWGVANAHLTLGDFKQVKMSLEAARVKNPPDWLVPFIYNSSACLYILEGQLEQAERVIEEGFDAARSGQCLIETLILEGNRGVVRIGQGAFEEATLLLEKTVKQLLARDHILLAAQFLTNLSGAYAALGGHAKARQCLGRAEGLIQESGSKHRMIFLKMMQGLLLENEGLLDKGERAYEEALTSIREIPSPVLEVQMACSLARLYFKKGNPGAALDLVGKALLQVRERKLYLFEDFCLYLKGRFLICSEAIREGMETLEKALEIAESRGRWEVYSSIALYIALGHEKMHREGQALEWLARCLEVTERCRTLPNLLEKKEDLTFLLLRLGNKLPLGVLLSRLLVQLRHPALLKRLLRHSPEGKTLFLRSLTIHDSRYFHSQLATLRNDRTKEVRRAARLLLNGWSQHAGYRVYTFGSLRVFLEGKMLMDKDWIRPGVKRLFLFLLTHSEKWHPTDFLLDTLWERPSAQRTRKVLIYYFSKLRSSLEPWHLPGDDYVFLQSQRGAYGFFPGERFWMDWKEFERGIKKAEKDHRDRNFKEARKAYREALDLYIGDYLEEFPYEDFLRPKRDYLRELYFRGVMRYAALERESGNLPEARRVLEEALFKDLSRCDCITLLIQTLAQMKLTQQAKEWGERHVKYIKKELREKPAPEVVEALARLK